MASGNVAYGIFSPDSSFADRRQTQLPQIGKRRQPYDSATCTSGACLLRLQAGQHHPDRGAAQAHRHGRRPLHRRRRPDLRDGRLPGTGDRDRGPSPSSDLYTVGRTLAVLTFDFAGFQGKNRFRLPDDEPLLMQQESYARLLRRATHRHPARRFQSAGEMAEQLTGVLREVLALADGQPRPAFSGLFSPELRAIGTDLSPAGAERERRPHGAAAAGRRGDRRAARPARRRHRPGGGYLATLAGLEPPTRRRRCSARSPATRASRRAWPSRRRPGWRSPARSSGPATWARRRPRWPSLSSPDRRLAGRLVQRPLRAGRRSARPGARRRSAPSTTSSRRARAEARARLRRRGGRRPGRRPALLPARVDHRPVVCQRRVRHGQGLPRRAATGSAPSPRSPPCRRRQATTPRRRSPPSGCSSPAGPGCPCADLHQADLRLGRLSLDDNDPRQAPARGGDPARRARLGVGRAGAPAAGRGPAASASSAASRTSARCASGSSAATARSPPCCPNGGSNWWTWPTASARGPGYDARTGDTEETAMTGLPGFTVDIDQNPYLPAGGRDVSAIVTVTADETGDAPAAARRPAAAARRSSSSTARGRWTTRRPSSPRPAPPPRPPWT